MKNLLAISLLLLLFSCTDDKIVDPKDYTAYLDAKHINQKVELQQKERLFWQTRLQKDTGNYVDMLELGYVHLSLFHLKGDVNDLAVGDSLVRRSSEKLRGTDPDLQQGLSQIAITQHKFKQAKYYIESASEKGSPFAHTLLSFDVGMELGEYAVAGNYINNLKDKNSFHYLIRKAKFEDHKGNLDGAIELMETAFNKVKDGDDKNLYCWSLSNLGDMYGHAGRIRESYAAYFDVLKKDPSYLYALKGIAWIAYANDGNTAEAKRILQFILSQTSMPDLYLTLAEIAEWEGNTKEQEEWTKKFMSAITKPAYGDMYNKYLIENHLENGETEKALAIAEKEVSNRATPETYSWLANVYLKKGDNKKALLLFNQHVKGKTFEPGAQLIGAFIMKANNQIEEAKALFTECLESAFELGPLTAKEVKSILHTL